MGVASQLIIKLDRFETSDGGHLLLAEAMLALLLDTRECWAARAAAVQVSMAFGHF
jgi:hypothetical protein